MARTAVKKAPPSETGRFKVRLSRAFERRKFTYKPGLEIVVSAALLEEMQAEGVVEHVVAAD